MTNFVRAEEAIEWINGARWKGEKNGLENTKALLRALGEPQRRMGRILHVAGTNGKGSTCAYLDGALRACGFKVGLFTSPYLRFFNERIQFDGRPIPDGDLVSIVNRVREKAEQLKDVGICCTTFELLTACACLYYADKGADYSVMEVGMGGMFDSTNVLDTSVTLVAAIGMDHMKALGDTEEEIAFQKAGIFKPSVPALVMPGKPGVMEVFRARASEVGAPFHICDEGKILTYEADRTVFECTLPMGKTVTQTVRVPGLHQVKNASLALSALSLLEIDMDRAMEGISQTVWAGRLDRRGNVLVDCGHNPQGAKTLKEYADRFFAHRRKVLLTGMMQDKQIETCSGIFSSFADAVVTTAVDWPRALAPEKLAEYYAGKEVYAVTGVKAAFEKAKELSGEDGLVIVAGSVYIAGAVIDLIEEEKPMEEKLLNRSEVPVNETWDLGLTFKTEEDMEEALTEALSIAKHIVENYKGKLADARNIADCLREYERYHILSDKVGTYAYLAVEVDFYDSHNQSRSSRVDRLLTEAGSELSFVDSEIAEQDEQLLNEAAALNPDAALYLSDVIRQKSHMLAPEAERVLAAYSQAIGGAPYETYNTVKLMDMVFPDFEAEGRKYPLGYSLFEDNYEYDARTAVRRAAFRAFSDEIRKYQNVTANAYNAQCQTEKITAGLRGFDSVFDYLLFPQKVTREMYDRQIDLITERLAPHMRRYAKLIQRLYKLDKMTFADLKLPLDAGYDPKVTIDGSREYIEKGLSILGDEYLEMVKRAYRERWVDFARNKGKETGGFCAGVYQQNSYILLSWNGRMSDVFTLAHELGHAGQSMYCEENQPWFNCGMSTYIVEAPSTCNELIMAHYLLKTDPDPRFRRWVLSCMVSNTYYHNFVTHLLEAAYQREVYRIIDAGGSVQAEDLCRLKREVLEKFWGDAVEIVDGAELTWMRQPHYYMGLYSYTYSAGLTVGTQAVKRMEAEGAPAVEDWKNMMKAGGTLPPAGLAKLAGIDITTDAALIDTIDTIGAMIDEIISLTDEIGE